VRAGRHPRGPTGDARDRVDRMAEQVAVVDAGAPAESPHGVAHLGVDERVDDDRRPASGGRHGML
jgi:hypothetical protein